MTAAAALRAGIARASAHLSLTLVAWLITVLMALPLAAAVAQSVAQHVGASLTAEQISTGADYDWFDEFAAEASGPAVTLRPAVIGFAAVLDNIAQMVDRLPPNPSVAAMIFVYMLVWTVMSGGIIGRVANVGQAMPTFLAACGLFGVRFLRLLLMQILVYTAIFTVLYNWLLVSLFYGLTAHVPVERTAFFIRAALYLVLALALAFVHLVFDYAKVRIVIDDRRSAWGAVRSAMRFIGRHAARVIPLYMFNGMLLLAVIAAYAVIAPGASGSGWVMWAGVALAQLFVAARLWARIVFWASEAALVEGTA